MCDKDKRQKEGGGVGNLSPFCLLAPVPSIISSDRTSSPRYVSPAYPTPTFPLLSSLSWLLAPSFFLSLGPPKKALGSFHSFIHSASQPVNSFPPFHFPMRASLSYFIHLSLYAPAVLETRYFVERKSNINFLCDHSLCGMKG